MSEVDWIVVRQDGLVVTCLRCGATAATRMPVAIDQWLAMARTFVKEHRKCLMG